MPPAGNFHLKAAKRKHRSQKRRAETCQGHQGAYDLHPRRMLVAEDREADP